MHRLIVLVLVVLAACNGSGGGGGAPAPLSPAPAVNRSVGGIWVGVRPNGTMVRALISEGGEFRVVDPFGNLGFGQVTVANTSDVSSDYLLVPSYSRTLIDGSDSATCSLTGSVEERVALDYEVLCTTALGGTLGGGLISMSYEPIYETPSSFARLAGNYDDGGDVLTVDINGIVFEQSARTGCVSNGQVAIIDARWNLYSVELTTENCGGLFADLSAAQWSGLATLLNDQGVDTILVALNAEVSGKTVALVAALPRI